MRVLVPAGITATDVAEGYARVGRIAPYLRLIALERAAVAASRDRRRRLAGRRAADQSLSSIELDAVTSEAISRMVTTSYDPEGPTSWRTAPQLTALCTYFGRIEETTLPEPPEDNEGE